MNGKVVVITGASSGIGARLADLLSSRGASLVLVARRKDALEGVAARCGPDACPVVADMTTRADVARVVQEALARFGRIDVWVNNAGQGISRLPSQLTDDDIDEMMRTNVKTALYGMQAVLPYFKERGEGHIVNISSMLGRVPRTLVRSAYSAAKHFLNALTANFRTEIQETHPDIQVSLVSPPGVKTEFGVNARHGGIDSRMMPEFQEVDDAVAVIAGVIESRRPDVYTWPGSHARVVEYFSSIAGDP